MQSTGNKINEGNYVIIQTERSLYTCKVSMQRPIMIGKQKFNADQIIGDAFGSNYNVKSKGKLERITIERNQSELVQELDRNKDNRNITDDGKSQKLTRTDIETLKAEGLSGKDIVESLIENSSTFKEKTDFSQAKYVNKKKQKYNTTFRIVKPTLRLIANMYYRHNPGKIQNLRVDSLSQMLAICNVLSGGRYITFDSCFGLLTAAVVQRLGGQGNVLQLHTGDFPPRNVVDEMNFTEKETRVLSSLPICDLDDVINENVREDSAEQSIDSLPVDAIDSLPVDVKNERIDEDSGDEPVAKKQRISDPDNGCDNRKDSIADEKVKEKMARKIRRQAEWETSRNLLRRNLFDGLLIASKHNPMNCLEKLLNFVDISRPVVVFCCFKEPLVDCYKLMKTKGNIINLKLTESWLRNYQVLPQRSHPEINMSGHGGYILSGIKIQSL